MTAIVRVKRRRGDDPVEALILSCKRKKTEDSDADSDSFKKILNFSGTVEEKDDKVATTTVHSFNSESKLSSVKNHVPEIRLKQRKECRERSEENRFTLLSCLRSPKGFENAEIDVQEDVGKNVTILDVSKEANEKSAENDASEGSYVYDLYSTNFESDSDFNDLYIENLLSIQPLENQLEYRIGEDCYDEVDPDEDDSNDENNWRNDYPDSDSCMEDDVEDYLLAKQLKGCHLTDDLSGDSGEEGYLNYSDEENYLFYEAEDLAGKKYARYKANAMRHMMDDGNEDEEDTDDEYQDCEVLSYHSDSD